MKNRLRGSARGLCCMTAWIAMACATDSASEGPSSEMASNSVPETGGSAGVGSTATPASGGSTQSPGAGGLMASTTDSDNEGGAAGEPVGGPAIDTDEPDLPEPPPPGPCDKASWVASASCTCSSRQPAFAIDGTLNWFSTEIAQGGGEHEYLEILFPQPLVVSTFTVDATTDEATDQFPERYYVTTTTNGSDWELLPFAFSDGGAVSDAGAVGDASAASDGGAPVDDGTPTRPGSASFEIDVSGVSPLLGIRLHEAAQEGNTAPFSVREVSAVDCSAFSPAVPDGGAEMDAGAVGDAG